jgi:hypothetical protein
MKTAVRVAITGVAGAGVFFAANRILRNFAEVQQHRLVLGGIIAGLGLLTWAAGKARRAMADRDNPAGTESSGGVPFLSIQFWGPVVVLCGALIAVQGRAQTFASQLRQKLRATAGQVAKARESSKSSRGRTKSGFEPGFKLQGIFYRKSGSSALIDGQTVVVGDWIGAAQVTAIEKTTVTVEVGGASRTLKLRK